MNIISEQEFGELLDEFIREGEFKNKTGNFEEDKQILNKIAGKTEKLENIEDRLPQMDERVKTIAALSDLAQIVEVDMLLGPDKIFTKQTSKVLSDSYSVAEVFNRLTDITQTAWDERVSLTGDNWKVTMAQCEAYIQDGVFKEYPEIDDILIGVIIAGEKQTEGREEVQVDTKKLDELFDGFRKYQLEDAGDRKKIYEYWAGTDATFKSFEEIVIEMPIMDAVIRLKREDPEQARTSMDNTRKVIIEKYSKVIDKINNLKIPKYTITYPTK